MGKIYKISDLFKTSWDELTPEQMIRVIDISEHLTKSNPDAEGYGFLVISMLRTLRKNKALVAKIDVKQAVDCFNDITFFIRSAKGSFITPWYFFPVANFSVRNVDFVRPALGGSLPMHDRNFDQLIYADSAFSNFCVLNHLASNQLTRDEKLQQEADECINALIAVLYTDHRKFSIADMDEKARLVPEKLDTPHKALILHTYANVRGYILDRCPHLFPKKEQIGEEEQEPAMPVSTGEMWLNLRYDLAETEAFKGLQTARTAMIYDALDYLDKKAREADEQRRKDKTNA